MYARPKDFFLNAKKKCSRCDSAFFVKFVNTYLLTRVPSHGHSRVPLRCVCERNCVSVCACACVCVCVRARTHTCETQAVCCDVSFCVCCVDVCRDV